ncbi:hypothetical protein Tco_0328041 [Tanacetum coccineum]
MERDITSGRNVADSTNENFKSEMAYKAVPSPYSTSRSTDRKLLSKAWIEERPRISRYSPSRGFYTRTPHRPQRPKKIVKTIWVKKGSTVGSQAVLPQTVKKSAMISPKQTWKPKGNYLDSVNRGNPREDLKTMLSFDCGCSGSMTGDKDKLSDFKEFKGGYVAFGNDSKGGRISGKGTIKTSCLDFEKVSYVEELKFNLLSVSQICDKKHNVNLQRPSSLITPVWHVERVNSTGILQEDEERTSTRITLDEFLCQERKSKENIALPKERPQQNGVAKERIGLLIEAAELLGVESNARRTASIPSYKKVWLLCDRPERQKTRRRVVISDEVIAPVCPILSNKTLSGICIFHGFMSIRWKSKVPILIWQEHPEDVYVKHPPGLKILFIQIRIDRFVKGTLSPCIKPQEHDLMQKDQDEFPWVNSHSLVTSIKHSNGGLMNDVSVLTAFKTRHNVCCLSVCKIFKSLQRFPIYKASKALSWDDEPIAIFEGRITYKVLVIQEKKSTSPHSRASSFSKGCSWHSYSKFCSNSKVPALILKGTASVQGTASFHDTVHSQGTAELQRTADFQGTAESHDAASIPKSPNDFTPTDASQTSGGDEGLLDIYALNREVKRLKKQTLSQAKQILKLKAKLKKLSKFVQPVVKYHALWVENQKLKPAKETDKEAKEESVLQLNWENKGENLSEEAQCQEDVTTHHFADVYC